MLLIYCILGLIGGLIGSAITNYFLNKKKKEHGSGQVTYISKD